MLRTKCGKGFKQMDREEFRLACEGFIDGNNPLQLADVLDMAYQVAVRFDKPKFLEKKLNGRVLRTLKWLEILFFVDKESDTFTFFGIKPQSMDMKAGGSIFEFPVIPLQNPAGEPQIVDWAEIMKICILFNNSLTHPAALPFVRIAFDESRASSLYYPLHKNIYS